MKEKIGRLFSMNIPPQRWLIYLLLLGTLPVVAMTLHLVKERRALKECRQEVAILAQSALLKQQKQWVNAQARAAHREADHFYVNNTLESIPLLQQEAKALASLIEADPSLPSKEVVARLKFLKGSANHLAFSEGVVESFAGMRETVESLAHPVQADGTDIDRLLSAIEGDVNPDRPLMVITDFKMKRKKVYGGNEVFQVDMKMVKREFDD